MVVIRLSRAGAKKRPFYSMVVTDSRKRRDGGYIERIGYFNPIARGQEVRLHMELDKLNYWQSVGAQISDRVKALIKEFKKQAAAQERE
jgi:small subunit ribosomal protein S16